VSAPEIARLQFATTTIFHFLFVLVTLGLVTLLVILQTAWVVTGKDRWERHTQFWGRLYVINYFLGIATGMVLELQFGLSWSGLSHYLGNVFGAALAAVGWGAVLGDLLGVWLLGVIALPIILAVHGWAFLRRRWPLFLATSLVIAASVILAGSRIDWHPAPDSTLAIIAPTAWVLIPLLIAIQAFTWWLFRPRTAPQLAGQSPPG
jgi:cytochrome bd-type quinol oxidase subunit 1